MKNLTSLFNFKNKKFTFQEVDILKIKARDVLVEIRASALCGTDLHVMNGDLIDKAYDKKNIILGHEWAGIVSRIGKGVKNINVGDRVFGTPHIPCGKCKKCNEGKDNHCDKQGIFGLSMPGSHAKFLLASETTIFKMPAQMNFALGSLLGDTISTAYHAFNKSQIDKEDKVLILGVGPVGLTIGLILKLKKVKDIFVMENESYRFSLAEKLFNAKRITKGNFLKNRRTFNFAFDTTGSKDALEYGFHSLDRGGELILVGVHNEKYSLDTLRAMYRELSIKGCFGYTRKEAEEFIKLSRNKDFRKDLKEIITHEIPLGEIEKAYGIFESKKSGKVVLII